MKKDLGKKYFHKHLFCLSSFSIESFIIDDNDHLTMCINKSEAGETFSAMISLTYMELDTVLRTLGNKGADIELLIAEALSSDEEMPAIIDLHAKYKHDVIINRCTLITKLFCMSMSDDEETDKLLNKGSHDHFYCFVVKDVKID
jgi:hypothetical protein